jgi:RNA polymerase sigma-70 factor (ECF subfamily)
MEEPTDAEVISRSLLRTAEFGAIFDRHAEVLLRFLVRRSGPDAGPVLLGELFRVAFERRAKFDLARESARPWLYGIASNLLMHQTRSEARRTRATRAIEDHMLGEGPLVPRFEAELVDEIDARLLLPRVAIALGSLAEEEREALLLFAWEDQSYREIAEALDVPIGTVRSRISRARGRLRELIGAGGKVRGGSRSDTVAREDN